MMVPPGTVTETVETLGRRAELLAQLLDGGAEKRALEDDLDISRSTLDRSVRELEALGVLTYADGEYALTPVGRRLVRNYLRFRRQVAVAVEFQPFLEHVSMAPLPFDLDWLRDAELFVPEPSNPYSMVDRHVSRLREMNRGRVILPIVGLHVHETVHETIVERGGEAELVVTKGVADVLTSDPEFAELTADLIATERFDLQVHDEIPYLLGVFDDEVVQMGVDDGGELRAMIEADGDSVLEWAREAITQYYREARPLAVSEHRIPTA